MVFGKKNSFTYFSATANCEFGINKIKVNYQVPDGMDIATALKVAGARTLYYLPVITALLGALVLTVMTLCLKHIWRFSSSTDPSNDKTVMTRAMGLFPSVESEWLYLVQYLHSRGAALIPLKIPLFEQLSASSLIEAQVDVLKKEIKIGKQRAKDWELNLEEMDFISGENVNLYALSEPSIIAIAEMAENKVEEVDKSTLTQAESIVEIMKPQT
jgi:seryl-tRNA synthetase